MSLDTGIVPEIWKKSNVAPVLKKGEKSVMLNYHINLKPVVRQLYESSIAKNTRDHHNKHNLSNTSQYWSSKSKSCLTNLLSIYKKVCEAADRDSNYNIIYLDNFFYNNGKNFDKIKIQEKSPNRAKK